MGNKLQECVAASFMQALTPYFLYSSKSFGKYWFKEYVYLISSKKLNETKSVSDRQIDKLI